MTLDVLLPLLPPCHGGSSSDEPYIVVASEQDVPPLHTCTHPVGCHCFCAVDTCRCVAWHIILALSTASPNLSALSQPSQNTLLATLSTQHSFRTSSYSTVKSLLPNDTQILFGQQRSLRKKPKTIPVARWRSKSHRAWLIPRALGIIVCDSHPHNKPQQKAIHAKPAGGQLTGAKDMTDMYIVHTVFTHF